MLCLRLSPPKPKRRGRLLPSRREEKSTAEARPQRRQAPAKHGVGSLTTGKLNAVRAAFKAGVKPSAIARQFGISQSDVRKALANEGRDQIWSLTRPILCILHDKWKLL